MCRCAARLKLSNIDTISGVSVAIEWYPWQVKLQAHDLDATPVSLSDSDVLSHTHADAGEDCGNASMHTADTTVQTSACRAHEFCTASLSSFKGALCSPERLLYKLCCITKRSSLLFSCRNLGEEWVDLSFYPGSLCTDKSGWGFCLYPRSRVQTRGWTWRCSSARVTVPQTSDAMCTASGLGSTRSGSHRWVIGATPALKPSGNLQRGGGARRHPRPVACGRLPGRGGDRRPGRDGWEGI